MHDLDTLPSSSNSAASDINNFGQVVGFSDPGTLNSEGKPIDRTLLYDSTGIDDLTA